MKARASQPRHLRLRPTGLTFEAAMGDWRLEDRDGIYLPQIDWHLDARVPVPRSFVSHAHSDHTALHATVLCSEGTARLMGARIGRAADERVLAFGAEMPLEDGTIVTLHPAGHVFGSAQFRARHPDRGTLLYTGDFKLRPGRSAEPCATPRADILIMETTFGRPHYVFPPTGEVLGRIVRFCREALDDDEVPVLFGYSLGKSQEILAGLAAAELPIALHPQTLKITRLYEAMGVTFPPHAACDPAQTRGHVVLCPPQSVQSAWIRNIQPRRTAIITGWAVDPGAVYRYRCDAAFPLSDHADYPDLIRFVETVQPRLVYTVHGFTREFARDLRARGIQAWAFGSDTQLELGFPGETAGTGDGPSTAPAAPDTPGAGTSAPPLSDASTPPPQPGSFRHLAETAESLRQAAGKLEKVRIPRGVPARAAGSRRAACGPLSHRQALLIGIRTRAPARLVGHPARRARGERGSRGGIPRGVCAHW